MPHDRAPTYTGNFASPLRNLAGPRPNLIGEVYAIRPITRMEFSQCGKLCEQCRVGRTHTHTHTQKSNHQNSASLANSPITNRCGQDSASEQQQRHHRRASTSNVTCWLVSRHRLGVTGLPPLRSLLMESEIRYLRWHAMVAASSGVRAFCFPFFFFLLPRQTTK
jgi:hypothetical protein